MKIRDLDFGHYVFGQAGVQGFFGEEDEHPHHKLLRKIFGKRFTFQNMVFVAKTITLEARIYPESSNTELREIYKLKRFFPKSIWVRPLSFLKGYMLNAVGLANAGSWIMLSLNKWQKREDNFQLSFMPDGETFEERIIQTKEFCKALLSFLPKFKKSFALQVNLSCPNTRHDQKQDPSEAITILSIFRRMIPELILIPKFNLLVEPDTIVALKPYCDAFCIGNSLPFGKLKDKKWWCKLFRNGKSPLLKYFGGKFSGGLSGSPLFPILIDWLDKMEKIDNSVVIIAGGGIMRKKDIRRLSQFKIVHAIALGCVATLRPWRLQSLIKYGNKVFEERNLMPSLE